MYGKRPEPGPMTATMKEDVVKQTAVLAFVIDELPLHLTRPEIYLALGDTDLTHRAVDDLIKAGLLREVGESIVPTRPAMAFDLLAEER